ncbi:MAG: hypothetical protein QOE34_182, partial [Verrucomicrobiota bacterium]
DLRFDPLKIRYNGSSRDDDYRERSDILLSFDFTSFLHGEQIQPLAQLPTGRYQFSVELSEVGRLSATFTLRDHWHELPKIEG